MVVDPCLPVAPGGARSTMHGQSERALQLARDYRSARPHARHLATAACAQTAQLHRNIRGSRTLCRAAQGKAQKPHRNLISSYKVATA